MSFAQLCGADSPGRQAACRQLVLMAHSLGLEQIRLSWCDQHGQLRGKTIMLQALEKALQNGIGMVSTILLKDTSDRTVYQVFEDGGVADLPGFEAASNLVLLPDPASFKQLPWAHQTGWLQCQAWFQNGQPVLLDTRHQLQNALVLLGQLGWQMQCGLEVEFHIYKAVSQVADQGSNLGWQNALDPQQAAWPGPAPQLQLIHQGYHLLSELLSDTAHEPLHIVQQTAQALGLPLTSLEIELGPSQVEAVFDVTDALTAADNMVLFRSAVTQALRRKGFYATFMCRPPFPHIMSSGWHLHQSLVDPNGVNLFAREGKLVAAVPAREAEEILSLKGSQWLAGLLQHAKAMSALATPTINGFERFRPHAMAPQSICWGQDNRGAMLRVVGKAGDASTHIENRLGEPAANPYLYVASQIHAGLDGIAQKLQAPTATLSPYAEAANKLPASLGEALEHLRQSTTYNAGFGNSFVNYFCRVKQSELDRFAAAKDPLAWQKHEYLGRI